MALSGAMALVVVGALAFIVHGRAQQAVPPATEAPPPPPAACTAPTEVSLHPFSNAEDPPAILWAERDARLELDGEPAFSPPEAPKHFKVGAHTFKASAPASSPMSSGFRLDPWKPALVFATTDEELGLVVVRLGGLCTSCKPPLVKPSLSYAKHTDTLIYLYRDAARLLRNEDWTGARELLAGVPMVSRTERPYLLLLAMFMTQTGQPEEAIAALRTLARRDPKGSLSSLLDRFQALAEGEQTRRAETVLNRWNKVTDRYGALIAKFEADARGASESHARRLEKLSDAFTTAAEKKDVLREDELERAAETAVAELVTAIRAARPDDCAFQSQVVATALQ